MRHKVVPDHLAVFHHESNALQLANVGVFDVCPAQELAAS
jgi:hypothetical protein